MNSRRQNFYYHIGKQNANDIQIKVSLRKVISDSSTNIETLPTQSGNNIEKIISWQEKIPNPVKLRRNRSFIDPSSRIGEFTKRSNYGRLQI